VHRSRKVKATFRKKAVIRKCIRMGLNVGYSRQGCIGAIIDIQKIKEKRQLMSEQRKSPSIDMNTTFKNGKSRAQKYNN
jgi:hypothetical protein